MSAAPQTPPPAAAPKAAPAKMLSLRLESKPIIYASYMSFTEFGGVFVPTEEKFEMGSEVMLMLELVGPSQTEKMLLKTNVCWINANPSAGGRPKGIGLAFTKDEAGIKTKSIIEAILTGLLSNERSTYTL